MGDAVHDDAPTLSHRRVEPVDLENHMMVTAAASFVPSAVRNTTVSLASKA
ncbi:MAG: hypothetical protein M3063_16520 [Actinomycetota bacterium]|nr:hypothetical protein [Actinomycetota bacterium]